MNMILDMGKYRLNSNLFMSKNTKQNISILTTAIYGRFTCLNSYIHEDFSLSL